MIVTYRTCHGDDVTCRVLEQTGAAYKVQQTSGRFVGLVFWIPRSEAR